MGLVQEKLTDEEKDTFMKELFNFFENEFKGYNFNC